MKTQNDIDKTTAHYPQKYIIIKEKQKN